MSEQTIYVRTKTGSAELDKPNGRIAGDEKRVMLLIDGASSAEVIGKKIPPSVRSHIESIFTRLLKDGFIAEVGEAQTTGLFKRSSRVSSEKVQESMMSSQKFSKDVLALAEIEIERRMELEQDLANVQAKLDDTTGQLNTAVVRYDTLKQQVIAYRQDMERRIATQQSQISALSGKTQNHESQKQQLEHDLQMMRGDFQHLQDTIEQKNASMDQTVQVRVLQHQQEEFEARRQKKIAADNMVQTHPHFYKIRGLDFFKKFRNSDLAEVLVWAEWHELNEGEIIITEGDTDITFYVVVTGKLSVLKGRRLIQILQPGEPFGELAYMTGEDPVRTTTVVARTECSLLKFNPAYLDEAELMMRMLFAESFMKVQAKRLRTTVEMVGNLLAEGA